MAFFTKAGPQPRHCSVVPIPLRRRARARAPMVAMVLALGAAAAVWTRPGEAGPSSFRCPTTARLVSVGQSTMEVRTRCREPDESRTTVEFRTIRETVRRWVQGVAQEVTIERKVEVPVDEWTYDFGRNRFIQFLRFESGRLISISEGGKGTGESE